MRKVFLVGESLPKKVGTAYQGLGIDLGAFDGRHGVFPNLVAKPLLSALYWLHREGAETKPLLDQLESLLTPTDTQKRFNFFCKKASKEPFQVDPGSKAKLDCFNTAEDLWLVFGVQTNFGLLGFLTGRFELEQSYKKNDILRFTAEFLRAALKHTPLPVGLPSKLPKQRTAQLGLLHRLCTDSDTDRCGVVAVLRAALKSVGVKEDEIGTVVARLRSMVPLLHNEAYQDRYDIGFNQAHFVVCQGIGKEACDSQLYWRVMGRAIAERLQGKFVQR